ncbi:MAG: dethiobiotin synthase [Acidobacteria bacterium]|nr:dethiobiotin synthase [Acidobacteriota bacterium]
MKGVFVTGTDTDVGKTVLCAALMSSAPETVIYWKPVQSGLAESEGDTATVRRLAGLAPERVLDEGYRLAAPASPHHAAAAEKQEVSLAPLLDIIRRNDTPQRRWVVEGVGGLLVPLSASDLLPEVIKALGLPVLVASSTRLGTINHTLLTLSELEHRKLSTLGVVLMGPEDEGARTGIVQHGRAPILARLPHLDPLDAANVRAQGDFLWSVPRIREVLT